MSEGMNRRSFLQKTAIAGAGLALAPSLLKAQNTVAPTEYETTASKGFKNLVDPSKPVRIAIVGCGGQGMVNAGSMRGVRKDGKPLAEIVAVCDVDFDRAANLFAEMPNVPRYKDYRKMLAEMDKEIDAVIVSTPDHMHYPVTVLAISKGKHVYVEKPAAHSIGEIRHIKALAKKMGVVTQMGNQGHAQEGCRLLKEWIEADVIGEIKEVHIWTNRPVWPQGVEPDFSKKFDIPKTLDWNLWLGVSPVVPFNPDYIPFDWRGMWNWGTGAIGDMACHMVDPIFTAIDMRGDVKVTPESEGANDFSCGKGGKLTYEFPAKGKRKAFKFFWYEGKRKPEKKDLPAEYADVNLRGNGMIYVGTKGSIMDTDDYGKNPQLMPLEKHEEFNKTKRRDIPRSTPRVIDQNNRAEFLRACQGGPIPGSNLCGHGAELTELGLLGVLAFRTNKLIDWDSTKGVCRGFPEASKFVHKEYRMF